MKKFYESPIVELTVFDVEDVITASAVIYVNTLDPDANLDALTGEIEGKKYAAMRSYATDGPYNW